MKAVRKIYTKSVRKLHKKFNPNHQPYCCPFSLNSNFFALYAPPKRRNCHLILNVINIYNSSEKLESHESLTQLINDNEN